MNMNLSLQKYGNPILREKAQEVVDFDKNLKSIAEKMLEIMYQSRGIGLAAEQAGSLKRIFVIDIPSSADLDENGERENPDVTMPTYFVNPLIINHSEEVEKGIEGCLSFPGMQAEIERWKEVDVEYVDLDGNSHKLHAKGLLARAIQHELDHLNGVLFIDRMTPVKKMLLNNQLKRLAKETKRELNLK